MIDFVKKLKKLSRVYKNFPEGAGIEAESFFKERFERKNWLDRSPEPWEPSKKPPDWVPKKWRKKRGSLMVDSKRLKGSIRVVKSSKTSVTIGTDVPYAQIHNEGGKIDQTLKIKKHSRQRNGRKHSVKAHKRKRTIKIPKRQFIGESAILLRRIERYVEREIKEALK